MIDETKKKIIRNWTFKIGYEKVLDLLNKEHDNLFTNLGNKDGNYDEKKISRMKEVVESIHYIERLKSIGAHQLSFFQ